MMEHELTILSPEKTILTYPLAGMGRRVMAQFLDVLIILALLVACSVAGLVVPSLGGAAMIFAFSAIPFLYFILQEGFWNGLTIGKMAFGLRVRMADGTPITFTAALGRNFVRVADFLPFGYFAGMLATFTTPRAQRLGDLVANTVVVRESRPDHLFNPAPHKAGIHPFESQVGDLRGMTDDELTDDEYVVLKRFCDRFPQLDAGAQQKLMDEIWRPFAERRHIQTLPDVHPLYLAEATVMKYGRMRNLL
jgi:uncharacterized RDD family membrane protein YckC